MKKICTVLLSLMLVIAMSATAFAAPLEPVNKGNGATVPVKATFGATAVAFDISESITATTTAADPTTVTYSNLVITNTMKSGTLDVTEITATGQNDWSVVADSSVSDWKALTFDAKKISMKATNGTVVKDADLSTALTTKVTIPNAGSTTYSFTGHTGAVSQAVSGTTIANVVATVALTTT